MRALLTKILGDLRQRRLQAAVIFVIVTLTAGVGTLGIEILNGASSPFDTAFEQHAGAHVQVAFDVRVVTPDQLAATANLPDVTASAGPWPANILPIAFGSAKDTLRVTERADPGGPVDRLQLVAGHWVTQPGEIVLTRSFADARQLSVGSQITDISRADKPTLTVVGEVVDIDEADVSLMSPQYAWVVPSQLASLLSPNDHPFYLMLYRFRQAATDADLQQGIQQVEVALPARAVMGTLTYLVVRQIFTINSTVILGFLLAFAAFALGAVALIIANVVTGAVLASFREIGVIKALGFTPGQVVLTFVGQMVLPTVAGCVIGAPLGVLGSIPILNSSYQALALPSAALVSPALALVVVACVLLIVGMAAALPALRAGLLRPVMAMTQGTAPSSQRHSRLSALLQRLHAPRPVSMGAGDAFARPVRGLLTTFAVLIAVATLTFAFGLQATFQRLASVPGVFGQPDVSIARFGAYPDSSVMQTLQAQPETARVVAYTFDLATVPGLSSPVSTLPMRGDSASAGYLLEQGRWFSGPGEAVGGAAFVNEAHLKVGDSFTATINNHPIQLRLVGVYYDVDNFGRVMRIDWSSYQEAQPAAQPTFYNVTLRAGANPQAYARRVGATEPDFLSVGPRASGTLSLIAVSNTVILVLAIVLTIIAIAGVFNTMLLNTRERMQDIATIKALGMSPGQVVSMVASAACVLGLLGGVFGIPVGIWLHRALLDLATSTIGDPFPASFYQGTFSNVAILLTIVLGGIVAALLGAALPARSAARHSVVEVLRAE